MNTLVPHYLLFADADRICQSGRWRFTLRTPDGSKHFEAEDEEPDARGERLELLTVVRAMEALDQPSKVTLVGCGPYVRQGLQYGLPDWRDNGWQWEFFGRMVPVKNRDLWQRLDRALQFHEVELRWWRIDQAHDGCSPSLRPTEEESDKTTSPNGLTARLRRLARLGSGFLRSLYCRWATALESLGRAQPNASAGTAVCRTASIAGDY